MRTGDRVIRNGQEQTIVAEYDGEFVYLDDDSDQMVHVSELQEVRA